MIHHLTRLASAAWLGGVVTVGAPAAAQLPSSTSKTSAAGTVGAATAPRGTLQLLYCRGKTGGMDLRLDRDPSPRDAKKVALRLDYARSATVPGGDLAKLDPGACSWNPAGWPGVPTEPGYVRFDLPAEAQPWSATGTRQIDTTADAAVFFPDPISLRRYLGDPAHYWRFFVDDTSLVSISFGAWKTSVAVPTYTTVTGPVGAVASDGPRELRCRGGATGLEFTRGAGAGTNLVGMTLGYAVSPAVPGETGRGLAPGTCAWVSRAGIAREPGRVEFTTAGNAQLKQAQSGGTVDRSPTAAERWPDANTIPAYMTDPGHFWSFNVVASAPTTARTNAAWKPSIVDVVATTRSPTDSRTSAVASLPDQTGPVGAKPAGSAGSAVAFDPEVIRNVRIKPGVKGVQIWFSGGATTPIVQVSTAPPFREPSTGRWILAPASASPSGAPIEVQSLHVQGTAAAAMRDYYATQSAPLSRSTEYHYLINAPHQATARLDRQRLPDPAHQQVGTFHTLRTEVQVRIDNVYIIDDSDDGSDGDLAFTFKVNDSIELELGTGLANRSQGELLDWASGSAHPFDDVFTIADAPDRLRIHVSGFDSDDVGGFGRYDTSWNAEPGGDASGDWNYARAEYFLDQYPASRFDFPFKIRTRPGSKLQFEVRGRVYVTRQ